MKNNLKEWLVWSIVGFGFFYVLFSFVGVFGLGWFVVLIW